MFRLPVEINPEVTAKVVEPLIEPEAAWIVVLPEAIALARPPAAMVATFVAEELHVAELVRFCMLPSL